MSHILFSSLILWAAFPRNFSCHAWILTLDQSFSVLPSTLFVLGKRAHVSCHTACVLRGHVLYHQQHHKNCLGSLVSRNKRIIVLSISLQAILFVTFCEAGARELSQYSVWLRTGWLGYNPRQRQRIFPLVSASRPALGPTQPPIQWVPQALSPGVKCRRGAMLTTHQLLMPRFRKSRNCLPSPKVPP
jgi:hypothetical protein